MAFTDAQIHMMWTDTNQSIILLGSWLNSASLWEIMIASVGFIWLLTLLSSFIGGNYSRFGFRARD